MTINPDGSFNLEKGESIPFICPKDGWPIPFDDKVFMVHCFHCGFVGSRSDFSTDISFNEQA